MAPWFDFTFWGVRFGAGHRGLELRKKNQSGLEILEYNAKMISDMAGKFLLRSYCERSIPRLEADVDQHNMTSIAFSIVKSGG